MYRLYTFISANFYIFSWNKSDTCLNWKCHLGYLKNKLLKIVLIIKNVSYFVNTSAMIKLYYALFYPYLIYCIEIWGHRYVSYLNIIYFIQKMILNIIFI